MVIMLSPRAFWDIDMQTLDEKEHAAFITARVLQYGAVDDIKAITRYYKPVDFHHAIQHTRGIMDDKTLALAKLLAQ